jgi:hypothetical protein
MMRRLFLPIVAMALLAGAGCGSNDTTTTPTTPTATGPTTVTWTGILPVPGSVSRSFEATQAGTVTVTLTAISQRPVAPILGIGIPQSGASGCVLTQAAPAVASSDPIFRMQVDSGVFCLKITDTGNTGTVTFSATLVHP